jgi:hypothetical protein
LPPTVRYFISTESFAKEERTDVWDIPGVHIVFDDLVIVAENEQEHDSILRAVLQRARQHCVCFNLDKLQLKVSKVNYVGHILSTDGISPDPEKVSAVINMQPLTDAQDLRRFIGMACLSSY